MPKGHNFVASKPYAKNAVFNCPLCDYRFSTTRCADQKRVEEQREFVGSLHIKVAHPEFDFTEFRRGEQNVRETNFVVVPPAVLNRQLPSNFVPVGNADITTHRND